MTDTDTAQSDVSPPPPELEAMLSDKRKALDSAKAFDVSGGTLRVGGGAMGGFVGGVTAVVGGAITNVFQTFKNILQEPDTVSRFQKLSENAEYNRTGKLSPEMQKEAEYIAERVGAAMEKNSGTLAANLTHNAKGWVAGLTAAGGALGLAWQMKSQQRKVDGAAREVQALEKMEQRWQQRVDQPENQDKVRA